MAKLCKAGQQLREQIGTPNRSMALSDPDWAAINAAHRQWILDGKHLAFKCPIDGGSIRGWTSI